MASGGMDLNLSSSSLHCIALHCLQLRSRYSNGPTPRKLSGIHVRIEFNIIITRKAILLSLNSLLS